MIAWKVYQSGEDYQNSYRWATAGIEPPPITERNPTANYPTADTYRQYVVGSLWAAFMAGFTAAGDRTAVPHDQREPDAGKATEADMRAFGASHTACYKWPEDTPEHKALRAAYIEGAADCGGVSPGKVEGKLNETVIESAISGLYEMPDHRKFWIDEPVAREITRRMKAILTLSPGKGEGWREERKQILDLIDTLSRRRVVPSFVDLKEAIHALPSPPISSRAEDSGKS